ncbi:alpha/beta hydrolase [Xanthobacter agilis]|uniref:alpha/beta hydrolase n=1 Tax=Xanthobacter agilis TaxID=47492 RepID=UPI00372C500D
MDLAVEYDNRARVPDYPAIVAGWARRSAAMRADVAAADLGVPYGGSPRQTLDILWPDPSRRAPVVLFFHGGYWQRGHPRNASFIARGCLAHGVAVAVAGYDLAPDVTLSAILGQARAAALCLARLVRRRLVACGHSAGAHLAAALVCTPWPEQFPGAPADLVPAGVGLSGVYDVEPLVATPLNRALKLTTQEARRLSPSAWPVPPGRIFDTVVGTDESPAFLRQSRSLADIWATQGAATRYAEMPAANHFTVLDPLADPESAVVRRLVELARGITL